MADLNTKPIDGLKSMLDAYGVGVRAGVLTPNIDDEIAIRAQFGLPPVNDAVRAAWSESGGVRFPITLAQDLSDQPETGPKGGTDAL